MVKILYSDGEYAPIIICDICGLHIKDAGNAAVVSESSPENGKILDVSHVHKGKCQNHAEAQLIAKGIETIGWEEMSFHMLDLLHNLGLDLVKLDELNELNELRKNL